MYEGTRLNLFGLCAKLFQSVVWYPKTLFLFVFLILSYTESKCIKPFSIRIGRIYHRIISHVFKITLGPSKFSGTRSLEVGVWCLWRSLLIICNIFHIYHNSLYLRTVTYLGGWSIWKSWLRFGWHHGLVLEISHL